MKERERERMRCEEQAGKDDRERQMMIDGDMITVIYI